MSDDHDVFAEHFEELDQQLRQFGAGPGLAEIHGMACGLLCSGRRESTAEDWRALVGPYSESGGLERVLNSVFALALAGLRSEDFSFRLLLPGEAAPISRRVETISEWCSGFMQAFARTGATTSSPEGTEAVADIEEIARIAADHRDDETQKRQLAEIEEYLRVATQLLFDESFVAERSRSARKH